MARLHLLEIHEQPWCPAMLRDAVTDVLRLASDVVGTYRPIVPKLARATEATGARRVVDLCAGAGGPWRSLVGHLPESLEAVILTDFFPNRGAFERAVAATGGRIGFHAAPVDATDVPPTLEGFRTLFTAFHHFQPEQARAILADAVAKEVGIAVFEQTERSVGGVARILFGVPLAALFLTPLMRPLSLERLFFTYAFPVIPALLTVDGVVSCLRTYSPEELRAIVDSLDAPHYEWDIGVARPFARLPVTYLVGHPRRPSASTPG